MFVVDPSAILSLAMDDEDAEYGQMVVGEIEKRGAMKTSLFEPSASWDTCNLARDSGLTVYDASYLALARQRETALATLDQRLSQAAASAGIDVLRLPAEGNSRKSKT